MKKTTVPAKKQIKQVERLLKLYGEYRSMRSSVPLLSRKQLPPLTLDEQLENINPYYTRNLFVKYE